MNDAGLVWTQLREDADGDSFSYLTSLPAFAKTLEVRCLRNNENVTDSAHTNHDYAYKNLLNAR